MSASAIAKNLTVKQLKVVLNKQPGAEKVAVDNKTTITEYFLSDIRTAGSKHLAYALKLSELEAATAHLEIDHGTNRKTKIVLSKRLKESLEEKGFTSWLQQCDDINVLRIFADNLEIIYTKSTTAKELVSSITKELELIGLQIVFGNLSVDLLRDLAVHLKRNNADIATSKTVLVNAITLNAPIPEPQKRPVKRVVKGTKRPIEKCTTYQQIFQHYNVDDIVEWCREQGVKTSGNKKDLIERVLAFLSGDKENTMSNGSSPKPTRKATTKKTETKKATTKKAAPKKAVAPKKVVEEEEVDDEEEEVEEEEVDAEEASAEDEEEGSAEEEESVEEQEKDQEASVEEQEKDQEADEDENDEEEEPEEMDIDAERALRTVEQSESEISMDSEEESIEGVTLCITGTLSKQRDVYEKAIKKAGGLYAGTLTKKVKYLIVPNNTDTTSQKFAKAISCGVEIKNEDFLKKLLKM